MAMCGVLAVGFAACDIDGINKENIYVPSEFVVNGEYKVFVNMYSNCQPSIPTNWSIVARYKGDLVHTTAGHNPASGTYRAYAEDDDFTHVMTFKITDAHGSMPGGDYTSWDNYMINYAAYNQEVKNASATNADKIEVFKQFSGQIKGK